MLTMLMVAAAATAVPAPAPGDDRTAILAVVNRMLALVGGAEGAKFTGVVDPEGRMVVVDTKNGTTKHIERPMRSLIEMVPSPIKNAERIGAATVLQRGDLAQVWAPYTFWVDGAVSHFGIDNFTLVKRQDKWIVTDLSYTKEPVSACAALGAPESPR